MGTDGAAVMLGRVSGVVVRVTEGLPYVLSVHCMAHRLASKMPPVKIPATIS